MQKILIFIVVAMILYSNPGLLLFAAIIAFFWMKNRRGKSNQKSKGFNFSNIFSSGSQGNVSSRSINLNGSKRFGSNEDNRRKELEEEAYFYRKNDGPEWKIEAADKELGRSSWESRYEDEKWKR